MGGVSGSWEDDDKKDVTYVAKISLREEDNLHREGYFRDVEMQSLAGYIATRFNRCNPPKPVAFLEAFVVELEEREGRPVCGVERYIRGPYRKHNSNFGYVSEEERNTPQAFSHFSWHISNGEVLVVDLQGVSDVYTDPQVHSVSGKGYGRGNLGMPGIRKFLETHRCNRICHYLRLPRCNNQFQAPSPICRPIPATGTIPLTQMMHHNISILTYDPRALENKPLTSTLPLLPGSPDRIATDTVGSDSP
uniref:Alpha-type protein kinase domain-containing protein n=1 Tax=Lotharella globosa TaxID=91324 RepID=A0A7S3YR87_9EUKA